MADEQAEILKKDSMCKAIIGKKDYYDILGLDKSANEEEIRKAYKKMAIKFHPDKNDSKYAADAFKKVSHAFSVLSNKEKKQNYDLYGSEEGVSRAAHEDIDPFDLFNMFMKNGGIGFGVPRGSNSSSSYVFKNGNVEYKVYSSFPGNGFKNMNSFFDHSEDDDGEDMFRQQIFGNFTRNINNKNRRHYNNSNNGTFDSDYSNSQFDSNTFHQRENIRRYQSFVRQCVKFCNMLPIIFLFVFLILPYINILF